MAGRRVVIVGVASHWGQELARRLARDPSIDYLAGIDIEPPSGGPRAHGLHRGRHPQPAALPAAARHRGGHDRPLRDPLVSRAGQAGAGPPRRQRDRHAPAPRRLRADPDPRAARRPRLGGDLRLRGGDAVLLHRGHGADAAAAHPLPARRLRARGVLRELRPPPPGARLLHAALPARDRAGARHAARPVPGPPGRCRPSSASTRGSSCSTPTTPTGALEAATRAPVRGPVNVAPSGSISLSHILRLVRRPALPIPHPLFGPALERLGQARSGPAPSTGTGSACFGSGAASTTGGCGPSSATSRASTRRARSGTSRRSQLDAGWGPPCIRADLAGRLSEALR